MASSYVTYTGTGSQTDFTIPFSYLATSDVFAFVNGVSVVFSWINSSAIRIASAPPAGTVIQVRRITQKNAMPVDFTDGSVLLEADLDALARYTLYQAQESSDIAGLSLGLGYENTYQANSLRIVNLASGVSVGDAVNKGQLDSETLSRIAGDAGTNSRLQGVEVLVGALGTGPVSNANSVVYLPAGTGAVATTVQGKLRENISLSDYATLQDAVNAAIANNIGFIDLLNTPISVGSAVDMKGVGFRGNQTVINNTANLSNVGPIRNCVVRGFPTDVDYTTPVFSSGLHKKLIYREASNVLGIFVKRRGRGYVRFEHRYNSFAAGAGDTGGSCLNWRSTEVTLMSEVFVYRHTPTTTSGTWAASTNINISVSFPVGTATAKQLQYKGSNVAGATCDFVVNASKSGQRGVAAIFCTSGSAASAELLVNGIVVRSFSAVGASVIREFVYDLPLSGANTVTLRNVSGGGAFLYVIGVEFARLQDVTSEAPDAVAWGDWDENYLTGTGANDYALLSTATGKYFGSYHGGETETTAPEFIFDGVSASAPVLNAFVIAEQVYLRQSTTIADGAGSSLQVSSLYRYFEDGVQNFDVCMSGSATVDIAYTCMSTTDARFGQVIYPTFINAVAAGKNLLGRHNVVKQINRLDPAHPLTLTTAFTLFPMGGKAGANMGGNGAFISGGAGGGINNKLYYGPAIDSTTTLSNLTFNTTRVFE